ncbi:YtxH domain-containing protein [Siphonobacter aquaeclarae]|jgi:gas vesicle protein|uniref:YtxH-like protein n=1 Tax=Siphonobacter aquaeclarae TaxID=563176 RepID=A0A1G9MNI9_9BACT|nr:YtxH domain-containing protein [Siphonobacter aquaeclarae]SDL75789.1 YtxH-like protein [Siphonobacter aquaeclarae]
MSKRSLIGYAVAGAVGVFIGMMIAPEKGSKNFKKVKRLVNDWASRALDEIEARKEEVEAAAQDARDQAFELKGRAEAKAEDLVDDVRRTYEEARSRES